MINIIALCISAISLIISFIVAIYNFRRKRSNAVLNYLNEIDSNETREARKILYLHKNILEDTKHREKVCSCYQQKLDTMDMDTKPSEVSYCKSYYELEIIIAKLIYFYDKWALLYIKKYLPKWAIEGPRETSFLDKYN